jgi:hypothetical protein
MTPVRARRRARADALPSGLTLGALLPLGLMVGSYECEDDDEGRPAVDRSAA